MNTFEDIYHIEGDANHTSVASANTAAAAGDTLWVQENTSGSSVGDYLVDFSTMTKGQIWIGKNNCTFTSSTATANVAINYLADHIYESLCLKYCTQLVSVTSDTTTATYIGCVLSGFGLMLSNNNSNFYSCFIDGAINCTVNSRTLKLYNNTMAHPGRNASANIRMSGDSTLYVYNNYLLGTEELLIINRDGHTGTYNEDYNVASFDDLTGNLSGGNDAVVHPQTFGLGLGLLGFGSQMNTLTDATLLTDGSTTGGGSEALSGLFTIDIEGTARADTAAGYSVGASLGAELLDCSGAGGRRTHIQAHGG